MSFESSSVKSDKTEFAAIKAILVYGFGTLSQATLPASQAPLALELLFSEEVASTVHLQNRNIRRSPSAQIIQQ